MIEAPQYTWTIILPNITHYMSGCYGQQLVTKREIKPRVDFQYSETMPTSNE